MNILVLDNDAEVTEYVEEIILNTDGLEDARVTRLFDGKQGHETLQQQTFDLIIMETELPTFDGISILQAFRKNNQETPVIILSGHLDEGKLTALRECSVSTALFKPVNPESIFKAITAALGFQTG